MARNNRTYRCRTLFYRGWAVRSFHGRFHWLNDIRGILVQRQVRHRAEYPPNVDAVSVQG